MYGVYHLEVELSGYNELATLHSDHYIFIMQVWQYCIQQ